MSTPDIVVKVSGPKTTVISSPTGSATKLTDLADVTANPVNDGEVLTYVAANGKFEFEPQASATSIDPFARTKANGAFDQANTANVTAQAAFDKANSLVTGVSSVAGKTGAVTLNTKDISENTSSNLWFTAARVRSNISNTTPINYDASTGTISHANSGATATTYGNTTVVPTITVDAKGHITSVVNTSIAFPAIIDQFARDHANGAYSEANAAYTLANTANTTAQSGYNQANNSGITAQAAFTKANGANVTAQAAFDKANSLVTGVSSVAGKTGAVSLDTFDIAENTSSNLWFTAARVRSNVSNTTPINYNASTGVISHAESGAVATTYGNTTFVPTITVDAQGHVTSVTNTAIALPPSTDEFARAHANGAFDEANSAYVLANTANTTAQAAFNKANAAVVSVSGKTGVVSLDTFDISENTSSNLWFTAARVRSNISNTTPINYDATTGIVSHADSGVSPTTYGNTTFVPTITVDAKGHVSAITNTAIVFPDPIDPYARAHANGAFDQANTANVIGQAAFDKANAGYTLATTANTVAASAYAQANIATTNADASFAKANAGFTLATTANTTAQASFDKANGAIYTDAQIRSNLSNTTPINYDATTGIISHADSGAVATTYGNTTFVPTITVDAKGHVTSIVNTAIALPPSTDEFARAHANGAFDQANTAWTLANTANTVAASSYNQANIATTNADASFVKANSAWVLANTANTTGQAAFDKANALVTGVSSVAGKTGAVSLDTNDVSENVAGPYYFTATKVRANVSNTTPINYDATTGIFSHALSGVAATGYGDGATIPAVVVDDKGHVTSVTNTSVAISASQVTSGTLAVGRGGTGQTAITVNGSLLIANTVSGGYDVNPLTQGTGILITNDKGSITIAATGGSAIDQYARDKANGAVQTGFPSINVATPGQANVVASTNNNTLIIAPGTGISLATDDTTKTVTITATGGSATDQFARDHANGAFNEANSAWTLANTANTVAASSYNQANIATTNADAAFAKANTALITGQAAFDKANGVVQTVAGRTGTVTLDTYDVSENVAGPYYFTAPRVRANISNTTPINYNSSTGVISFALSGVSATGYGSASEVPVFVVDAYGRITSVTNTTIAISTTNVSESAGGPFYFTAPRVRGNVSNTTPINYDATTGIFSHALSGVAASGYGDGATIPVVVVDSSGHVTSAVNTAIAISASQVTSGTLAVGRGGTGQTSITVNGSLLIGNTVSGGYDVNPLTQGTGILITNDKGSITIAATGGAATDQFARDHANGAFDQANTANTVAASAYAQANIATTNADAAFAKANSANNLAQSAFANANTAIYTAGQIRANISNTAPINYDATTGIVSHADSGVAATGYGSATQVPVLVVDAKGHITSVTNTAISVSAGSNTAAPGSIQFNNAGTLGGSANLVWDNANGYFSINNPLPWVALGVSDHVSTNISSHWMGYFYGEVDPGPDVTISGYYGTGFETYAKANNGTIGGIYALYGNCYHQGPNPVDSMLSGDFGNGRNYWSYGGPWGAVSVSIAVRISGYNQAEVVDNYGLYINAFSGATNNYPIYYAGTVPFVLTGTGKVGIGNTAPSHLLSVSGNAWVRDNLTVLGPYITQGTPGTLGQVLSSNGAGTYWVSLDTANIASGTLSVTRGGTGQSAITVNGSLLIANTVSGGYDVNTLTQGSGITITNDKGSITIAATGGAGSNTAAPGAIQFNNAGTLGGSANLVWDNANGTMILGQGGQISSFKVRANTTSTLSQGINTELRITTNSISDVRASYQSVQTVHPTGNIDLMIGCSADAYRSGNGNVTQLSAFEGYVDTSDYGIGVTTHGIVYHAYEIYALNPIQLINAYGFKCDAQTMGTNNYGLWIDQFLSSPNNFPIYYNGTVPFVLTGAGRVGIGNTTPAIDLHIHRTANASVGQFVFNPNPGASASADLIVGSFLAGSKYGYLSHAGTNYNDGSLYAANTTVLAGWDLGGLLLIGGGSSANMIFATGGYATTNERMRISSNGQIHMGSTAPDTEQILRIDSKVTSGNTLTPTETVFCNTIVHPTTDQTVPYPYDTNFGVHSLIGVPPTSTMNVGGLLGVFGEAKHYGSGECTYLTGVQGYGHNANSANVQLGGIDSAITGVGGYAESDGGIVSFVSGVDIGGYVFGGTVTNLCGIRMPDIYIGGGTVTNRYGIWMGAPTGSATNDYGIYQTGTQKNYFGGPIGIGATPITGVEFDIKNILVMEASLDAIYGPTAYIYTTEYPGQSTTGYLCLLGGSNYLTTGGIEIYGSLSNVAASNGVVQIFRTGYVTTLWCDGRGMVSLNGAWGRGAPVTKTGDFTLANTENWIIHNKSGSSLSITLPAAAQWTGREVMIQSRQAQTVVSAASDVVPMSGGAAGTAILAAKIGNWALLVSDGTNWVITEQGTSGTLTVSEGGTGQTAITVNGSLLIANTVSGGYDVNPLTQGSGILITNDKGSITIASTSTGGNGFGVLVVSGQSDVVADQANDTLTIVAGTGVTITTNAGTDTITLAAADAFASAQANAAFNAANTAANTTQGLHAIWVPAWAMYPQITNGASPANGAFEMTTNKQMLKTLDYDTTTQESAQFTIKMPRSYNLGTVTANAVWSHGTTVTNFGVTWLFDAYAFSDGDAIDAAFGTAVPTSDTGGTANTCYISPPTSAITIGGTPAAGDWVVFRVARQVANTNDTLAIDARLHGVEIMITTNANTDA